MPDETIYITDVENALLGIFLERKVIDNETIINTLEQLIEKLKK